MLGLVLVSFTLANLHALVWLNVDWLLSAVLPAVVVEETNDERADGAIGPLLRNTTLDRAAQRKAEHMAELGYFAHYAPDGTSPWHWFRSVNYPFVHAGENLAVHFNDSQAVVEAWMDSPTHRANIMNGNYTEIGIGVAEGEFEGYDTVFVVQLFGTPAAVAATSDPTPPPPAPEVLAAGDDRVAASAIPATAESPRVAAAEGSTADNVVAPDPVASEPVAPTTPVSLPETPAAADSAPITPAAVLERELPDPSLTTTSRATGSASATEAVVPSIEQFISTTTNAVPATVQGGENEQPLGGWFGRIATSPHTWLQSVYVALGSFVVFVLVLSLGVEFRRQQPIQVVYTLGLLAVMGGLYYLQTLVTVGATIAAVG